MKNLFRIKKVNNITKFIFGNTFKNYINYVYLLVLPIIIFLIFYLVNTSFGQVKVNSLEYNSIISLTIIGPATCLIPISKIITDWRESVLIKQLKIFNIKKSEIVLSFWILSVVLILINYFSLMICGLITDLFLTNSNYTISLSLIRNFHQWLGIFIILVLASFPIYFISYIIAFSVKSTILVHVINLVIIGAMIGLGDVFNPNLFKKESTTLLLEIFGYFNPLKAIQWLLFSNYVNLIDDINNVRNIIYSAYVNFPFTFGSSNPVLIMPMATVHTIFISGILFVVVIFIKMKKI